LQANLPKYPDAPRDESIVDEFFGVKVSDPYRALEDSDSPATKSFVEAQNKISSEYLASCPDREKLRQCLTDLKDYPRYSVDFREGDRYFYWYNSGLQAQSVLKVRDTYDGEPRTLLDPNTMSEEGTVSIGQLSMTRDGSLMAYCQSSCGLDWKTIRFKRVADGSDLPDQLDKVKFSGLAWTADGAGVFYSCYPHGRMSEGGATGDLDLNHKLMYHKLGEPQSRDRLCAEFPDAPKWLVTASVSDCGQYALIFLTDGCKPANQLHVCQLAKDCPNGVAAGSGPLPYTVVSDSFDCSYHYITNDGPLFYLMTNGEAPRNRIVTFCLDTMRWLELVPQHETDVLSTAAVVNRSLILSYRRNVQDVLLVTDLLNRQAWKQIEFGLGTVGSITTERWHNELFFSYSSFLTPSNQYRVEFSPEGDFTTTLVRKSSPKGFDASEYTEKQVFYTSKDGTRVPMFIVRHRDLEGPAPCLLYGYGGFNISIMPYFSTDRLPLLRNYRCAFAVANIRGGDEFGEDWHLGGCLMNKQNCFDDFIAAAEYLVKEGVALPDKLVIEGASNGGLLVAACALQRPDLYAGVVCSMGVLDMLRFHKFTIGHGWVSDYGTPDGSESEFRNVFAYSPLHNVARVADRSDWGSDFPALLVLTASHDDRVMALHSLKFVAEVQYRLGSRPGQTRPLLARIETKDGHGFGRPLNKTIEERADVYCFMQRSLALVWRD
uniref:Prolyl endopeptidase n=1 Tax=Macrostomum lignano TaxID=282301 RepID=A0A1I8IER6_9PLAT